MNRNIFEKEGKFAKKEKQNFGIQYVSCAPALVKAFDIYTAYVYGVIWSKCQLSRHICYASYKTLARETGISVRTIARKIPILIDRKLIEDINPNPNNHPGMTREFVCNIEVLKEFVINEK